MLNMRHHAALFLLNLHAQVDVDAQVIRFDYNRVRLELERGSEMDLKDFTEKEQEQIKKGLVLRC